MFSWVSFVFTDFISFNSVEWCISHCIGLEPNQMNTDNRNWGMLTCTYVWGRLRKRDRTRARSKGRCIDITLTKHSIVFHFLCIMPKNVHQNKWNVCSWMIIMSILYIITVLYARRFFCTHSTFNQLYNSAYKHNVIAIVNLTALKLWPKNVTA